MVKVRFRLISHELGGLPVMARCCNLELMLKSSLDHIKRGNPKTYRHHSCLGTAGKKIKKWKTYVATFLTKWQINSRLGYNLRHSWHIPLTGINSFNSFCRFRELHSEYCSGITELEHVRNTWQKCYLEGRRSKTFTWQFDLQVEVPK